MSISNFPVVRVCGGFLILAACLVVILKAYTPHDAIDWYWFVGTIILGLNLLSLDYAFPFRDHPRTAIIVYVSTWAFGTLLMFTSSILKAFS
jgi:hypothetical protein